MTAWLKKWGPLLAMCVAVVVVVGGVLLLAISEGVQQSDIDGLESRYENAQKQIALYCRDEVPYDAAAAAVKDYRDDLVRIRDKQENVDGLTDEFHDEINILDQDLRVECSGA